MSMFLMIYQKYEQNKHDFLESRLMNYSNGNLEGIVDSIFVFNG